MIKNNFSAALQYPFFLLPRTRHGMIPILVLECVSEAMTSPSFLGEKRPSLTHCLFLFLFLFLSFTRGNKKGPTEGGLIKKQQQPNIEAYSRENCSHSTIPRHLAPVVALSLQDAAPSSLSPFCLAHSPIWFCSCLLSFLFSGSILFCGASRPEE